MEEEKWCMQWSSEVLPEQRMVPNLSVFAGTAVVCPQSVFMGESCQPSLLCVRGMRDALYGEAQGKFPARLRLPFTLLPAGSKGRPMTPVQPGTPLARG